MNADIANAMIEARRYSAYSWPDGVTLDTYYTADSIQTKVNERARLRGQNSGFGEQSSLVALHALAVWVCRLPRAEREAVLAWIGGKG